MKDLFSKDTIMAGQADYFIIRKKAYINVSGYPRVECEGKSKQLSNKAFGIGRDKHNALIIADPKASKYHAVVKFEKGIGYIRDQHSKNGTYINGREIPPDRNIRLAPGDEIRIGQTVLMYVC
ncbi:MAG: FHA domain-containing protein [Spirochaetales bacterium]|nr:FHA domain-containing protein [Spirochaetales bacterium]